MTTVPYVFYSPTTLFSTSKPFTTQFEPSLEVCALHFYHDLQWHLQHSKKSGSWSVLFYLLEISITHPLNTAVNLYCHLTILLSPSLVFPDTDSFWLSCVKAFTLAFATIHWSYSWQQGKDRDRSREGRKTWVVKKRDLKREKYRCYF